MDDLVNSLASTFEVTKSENNIYSKHPRFDQYKQKTGKAADQNVRRKDFLKQQKQRRCDFLNHVRGLAVGDWNEEDAEKSNSDCDDMEVTQQKFKPPKRYKDQLMLSEWLVDVPKDFHLEWLMLVCPIGKRNLVVAAGGRTSSYSKSGYCVDTFASCLPGGSIQTSSGYTVLDCIYSTAEQIFYVLDVMCWNNHPVYDSETEFRFFWLKTKLNETSQLATVSKSNSYKFLGLCNYACTKDQISLALADCEPNKVDGLLFYHKRTHYTFGSTPLVTWLKVPMVKEILEIDPPPGFSDFEMAS